MTSISLVMKTGGDYGPQHVRWMRDNIRKHNPDVEINVFTDCPTIITDVVMHPLTHELPGWWSKLEVCRPGLLTGSTLFIDLDVVVKANIDSFLNHPRSAALRGFKRTSGINSSLMLLSEPLRAEIWREWVYAGPQNVIKACGRLGDQKFIGDAVGDQMERWQTVLPGDVVSMSAIPKEIKRAKIVVFHGKPRPWQSGYLWVPKLKGVK